MRYNSTIRQKTGLCPMCLGKGKQPLTKGMCNNHYWEQVRMKSVQKQQERELAEDESLQTLVDDLDIIFSRYVRLKDADNKGMVECYCCRDKIHWKRAEAAHFIPRAHMYTRYLEENVKPNCTNCNSYSDGNLKAYAEHLEQDKPGSVELLREQGRIVYHYTREELKAMIKDYSQRIKLLSK